MKFLKENLISIIALLFVLVVGGIAWLQANLPSRYPTSDVILQEVTETDKWEWHRQQAIKAKMKKADFDDQVAEFIKFCGNDNVVYFSEVNKNFYSFECANYEKVPNESLMKQ